MKEKDIGKEIVRLIDVLKDMGMPSEKIVDSILYILSDKDNDPK